MPTVPRLEKRIWKMKRSWKDRAEDKNREKDTVYYLAEREEVAGRE